MNEPDPTHTEALTPESFDWLRDYLTGIPGGAYFNQFGNPPPRIEGEEHTNEFGITFKVVRYRNTFLYWSRIT